MSRVGGDFDFFINVSQTFKVLVDGSLCGTVGSMDSATFVDVECSSTILGSVVVIYITTSDSVTKISACEIEVYEGLSSIQTSSSQLFRQI